MPDDDRQKLITALKDCSEELATWVEAYYKDTQNYQSERRRYTRDMQPVWNARQLIASIVYGITSETHNDRD